VIPIVVIQELDKIKVEPSERGYNARKITRHLDDLRDKNGSLTNWQTINEKNGRLCIKLPENKLNLKDPFDDQILAIALEQKKYKDEYESIALVTLDTNLRVKADAYGLGAQSYTNPEIKDLNVNNTLHIKDIDFDITDIGSKDGVECPHALLKNQCVILYKQDGHQILAREKNGRLKVIKSREILGIKGKNAEQKFAMEMLLDPDISLVTLQGIAGTGKSLLTLVTSLQQVIDGQYNKLIISRPVVAMGNQSIGYLPGTVDEKIMPYMKAIFDNLEIILMSKKIPGVKTIEDMKRSGIIEIEPLTYIRGRSIPGQIMMIDETQSLSPLELKTIISRCGDGTKLILNGDIDQIDSPYLNKYNNGLTHVVNKLKDEKVVAHITLEKGERSHLANLAAEKL